MPSTQKRVRPRMTRRAFVSTCGTRPSSGMADVGIPFAAGSTACCKAEFPKAPRPWRRTQPQIPRSRHALRLSDERNAPAVADVLSLRGYLCEMIAGGWTCCDGRSEVRKDAGSDDGKRAQSRIECASYLPRGRGRAHHTKEVDLIRHQVPVNPSGLNIFSASSPCHAIAKVPGGQRIEMGCSNSSISSGHKILLRQRRVVSLCSLAGRILYLRRAALQQVESSHFPWSSLARPQERNAATTQQCSGDTQQVAGDQRQGHACGDDRRQGDHPGCGKDRSR